LVPRLQHQALGAVFAIALLVLAADDGGLSKMYSTKMYSTAWRGVGKNALSAGVASRSSDVPRKSRKNGEFGPSGHGAPAPFTKEPMKAW